MREIKHRFFLDISVGEPDEEEQLPESDLYTEEQLPQVSKKIKIEGTATEIESTDTEKFEELNFLSKDFTGRDMNLAKLITIQDFGFISKVTPHGFHTVQVKELEDGSKEYQELEFTLYDTLEDYPKYNRFVLSTFMFITLLGHEKEYFASGYISFKLVGTEKGKDLSNYWLIVQENQRHPR
jgi:hypothetical protein